MIKVWFLMALMSYPNIPAISYKGFGGFLEKEKCEEARVIAENQIAAFESRKGKTVYIETYCMEFNSFESSLSKKDKNTLGSNLQLNI
jgi:hypothetical protein|tara:strand:+ start:512 stop:775 length:264 start_codon:yes stop_codon:yes gene_type:complete